MEVFSFSSPQEYRGWDLGSQSRAIKSAVARKPSSIGTDRGGDVPDHSVNESQASQKPASELSPVPRREEKEEEDEDEDEDVGGREAEVVVAVAVRWWWKEEGGVGERMRTRWGERQGRVREKGNERGCGIGGTRRL